MHSSGQRRRLRALAGNLPGPMIMAAPKSKTHLSPEKANFMTDSIRSAVAQAPVNSRFGAASTIEEVLGDTDLKGRTAVITGGASGLGLETTRAFAARGAKVIVGARKVAQTPDLSPLGDVRVEELDLLDPASIHRFSVATLRDHQAIDLLVCSAGVMASPLFRDRMGHEGQFATNHLGHFRLTCALWPALSNAPGSRVVVVSSRGHQIAGVNFDDIDFSWRPYDKWVAYGQSKTANALFAVALDARRGKDGPRAFAVHPGSILSPLARHLSREEIDAFGALDRAGNPVIDPSRDMKSIQQGAATIGWAACSPLLSDLGGVYCEDCNIAPIEGEKNFGVRPWAVDPDLAEQLWTASVAMTGADITQNR